MSTMHRAVRTLIVGQMIMFGALLACTIIDPHYLLSDDQGGVSNFGTQLSTVIPYSVGLFASSVTMLYAAGTLRHHRTPHTTALAWLLRVVAIIQLLVLASTFAYKLSTHLHGVHVGATQLFFVAQIIGASWVAIKFKTPVVLLLYGMFLTGFLLALLTLFGMLHVLFIAEIVATFSFGALLVAGTHIGLGRRPATKH